VLAPNTLATDSRVAVRWHLRATTPAGYRLDIVEKYFPLLYLNTSNKHNRHHEKTINNYGEIAFFWVCRAPHPLLKIFCGGCRRGFLPASSREAANSFRTRCSRRVCERTRMRWGVSVWCTFTSHGSSQDSGGRIAMCRGCCCLLPGDVLRSCAMRSSPPPRASLSLSVSRPLFVVQPYWTPRHPRT